MDHKGKKIYQTSWSFPDDILDWGLKRGETVRDRLTDEAWDHFYKSMKRQGQEEEFYQIDDLAGDRYITHIDLDGDYVDVSIWDELEEVQNG